MPSLLLLAGIMDKDGGYGGELSGFGGDDEEDESRALRVALGQLSLLGLGDGVGTQERTGDVRYEAKASATGNNVTECVPVPSSEHVAEIVGRQGCKIKALRAKTNTYIKTPVRGEDPVFLITGRKEDVALARREIISAAEHFSMLRASRNKLGLSFGTTPPAPLPGQTTIQVRVPYRVVGLVVGPKGSTIKRIQQQTCTYIVTPSRDRDPVFEITGSPSNAERAREEIEAHIAFRTGGLHDLNNENACLGPEAALESRLQQVWGQRKPLASSYRHNHAEEKPASYFSPDPAHSWGDPDYTKQGLYSGQQRSKNSGVLPLPLSRLSPGHTEPLANSTTANAPIRDCMTCFESKVTAALVPCGHNLFCMECAVRICELSHPECPACHSSVTQAIRIFS